MFSMILFRSNNRVANRNENYYNPFSDDFFRAFFGDDFADGMLSAERPLKVDVRDEGDHYLLEADMPGMKRENVHVDVEDGVLTISTQIDEKDERTEKGKYIYRERRYGRSSRSFNLDGIEENGITAEFKDGVLKLTLPKEKAQQKLSGRTIEIQ